MSERLYKWSIELVGHLVEATKRNYDADRFSLDQPLLWRIYGPHFIIVLETSEPPAVDERFIHRWSIPGAGRSVTGTTHLRIEQRLWCLATFEGGVAVASRSDEWRPVIKCAIERCDEDVA